MKVSEGKEEDDEYIVSRLDNTIPPINIINIYGTQESRSNNDEIERSWLRLMKEVEEIENRNEAVIIIGDMNRHVGNGDYGVKNNKDKISFGGQLIRNLIKDGLYILINNLDIVEGGPWTWVDRRDNRRRSCLDLAIISISILPYLTKMEIDTERKITPRRVTKTKNGIKSTFSDHFSLKIQFKGIPKKEKEEKPKPKWNLNKPDGWVTYKSKSDKEAAKIEAIVDNEDNIETVMKKVEAINSKVKFQSFGKTKIPVKKVTQERKCTRLCQQDKCNNCKKQEDKDAELLERRAQQLEKAIQKIKDSKQGRAGNIFRIRKEIAGPKKSPQEASSIRDPKTGEILVNKNKIKEATLEYCIENLKQNVPDDEFKEVIKNRKERQTKIMNDKEGETFEVDYEEYEKVLTKFARKDTNTYDFILKSGDKYKMAIYKICKRIIEKEEVPESFHKTVLMMIWKRKGSMEIFFKLDISITRIWSGRLYSERH